MGETKTGGECIRSTHDFDSEIEERLQIVKSFVMVYKVKTKHKV